MVLDFCGNETSGWSQPYSNDPDFTSTYQEVSEGTLDVSFHVQYDFLCHLGHLYIHSSERVKLIWESHYNRVVRHFGVDKMVAMFKSPFIGQNFNMMLANISDRVLPMSSPNQPLISRDCTHPY